MQDFHVIEKDQIVPVELIESDTSSSSSSSDETVESVRLLFMLPSTQQKQEQPTPQNTHNSERAAKILLALVASMVASQLLILGIALLIPRSRMIRVSSLVVSEPGTLVLKQETPAGIDYLFIFFHPIPALIEATRKHDAGFVNWFMSKLNGSVERAFEFRDAIGRSLFDLAAQLVASRPYQQVQKLISSALQRIGLPS